MPEKAPPRPTNAELAILRVLWRDGPSTVRHIHRVLSQGRDMLYTTVLKFLQIMTEKGLVACDRSNRAHVYTPRVTRKEAERAAVGDLMDRVFGGSAARLVMHALSSGKASAKEVAEIRKLLDEIGEEEP